MSVEDSGKPDVAKPDEVIVGRADETAHEKPVDAKVAEVAESGTARSHEVGVEPAVDATEIEKEEPLPADLTKLDELRLVKKHPRAIRWMHWVNFPVLFIMIWSGLLIYWGDSIPPYQHPHEVYRVWDRALDPVSPISQVVLGHLECAVPDHDRTGLAFSRDVDFCH